MKFEPFHFTCDFFSNSFSIKTQICQLCNTFDLNLLHAAKNLILAGVKSVTLHDEGNVELWDLSSNFVFSENDLGKNRALASVNKLQELNNAVLVLSLTTQLTKEQLSNFQVLLLLLSAYFLESFFFSSQCIYMYIFNISSDYIWHCRNEFSFSCLNRAMINLTLDFTSDLRVYDSALA